MVAASIRGCSRKREPRWWSAAVTRRWSIAGTAGSCGFWKGASSSVAIISRRSIALPAGSGASAGQSGKNVVVGKPLVRPVPAYPYEAQQQRVEGTVKVHAVVGTDGTVRSVDPISGPEPLMDAARTAVREWRFAPTKLDGRPVDVQDDVTLFFRLPN